MNKAGRWKGRQKGKKKKKKKTVFQKPLAGEGSSWQQSPPFHPHIPTSTSARKLLPLQPRCSPSTVSRDGTGCRLASRAGRCPGAALSPPGCAAVIPRSAPGSLHTPGGHAPLRGQLEHRAPGHGVAQEAGWLLPGDPPPLGRVILPTPGPDPSGSSHTGHAGTVLSHLLRSREAGAPAARESVRVPRAPWSCRPATAAARTVRGAGGDRREPGAPCALPSLRAAPFFRVLSCQGTPNGAGGPHLSPHLVLRPVLGRSRVLADFPPLWTWGAGRR